MEDTMAFLEVIARAVVRPGQLAGLTAQAAEIVRLTREQDAHTLRCDWFVDDAGKRFEVHELFPDEQGLLEHKVHTMEATARLFRDYASDHHSTLYGKVSPGFITLVKLRMGVAPGVFSFLQGLESGGKSETPTGRLEVHAHLRIRPGQQEAFAAQAAELIRLTRELDTQTIRYDWFVNEDRTACEVHEAYLTGQGLVEHNAHVMQARSILLERSADDHRMTAFGEVSEELRRLGDKHAGGIAVYSFLQGLGAAAAV
jgi:quinol monooxygenase YgiN